jgi:hypothetical protein
LMIVQAFLHASIFTCFLRGLCGQKTAAYAPQGLRACRLSASKARGLPVALLLRTGNHKTLLYQVETMEIRTPLD